MAASLSIPSTSGGLSFCVSNHYSATVLMWGFRRDEDTKLVNHRSRGPAFRVLANPNVSPSKGSSKKEVIMVDPLEAKRLAAKQMEVIKAKQKLKRRRQIEAINGAWAMIGLTAGLVIEGQTGNSILSQVQQKWTTRISTVHFSNQWCGFEILSDRFLLQSGCPERGPRIDPESVNQRPRFT